MMKRYVGRAEEGGRERRVHPFIHAKEIRELQPDHTKYSRLELRLVHI